MVSMVGWNIYYGVELEMKAGDILVFKGSGLVFEILSRLVKCFEQKWDRWGWHMAIVFQKESEGWYVLESQGNGVNINFYSEKFLRENTCCYEWFDKSPSKVKMGQFLIDYNGKSYDVAVYFWTAFQYLIRHFWNRRIPRLLDDQFTCWELVFEFCEVMGKPIGSKYNCPIITDALKAFSNGD